MTKITATSSPGTAFHTAGGSPELVAVRPYGDTEVTGTLEHNSGPTSFQFGGPEETGGWVAKINIDAGETLRAFTDEGEEFHMDVHVF